ncbi:MAG TPA: DUF559 domain-containing protein [Microlunatus sp.]
MREDIELVLRTGGGVIRRADHPELAQCLDRLRGKGELVSLLPGILAPRESADDWAVRVNAGVLWAGPDAVLTRYAAARMTFWPECSDNEVGLAVRSGIRHRAPGWPVTRASVPPEMVWQRNRIRVSCPAYTAVELAAEVGGSVIDRVLRTTRVRLADLWDALAAMEGRPGNRERRRLLKDSRDSPWSELERDAHRLFRQNQIIGWSTNARVSTSAGDQWVDVLFRQQRVIVEFDGFEFHSDRAAFERDRARRNELVLAGYLVLNFTWAQLHDRPEWVIGCIRRAVESR